MTVKDFIQGIMLIIGMMVTSVVLPIVLIVGSASHNPVTTVNAAGPVFVFRDLR